MALKRSSVGSTYSAKKHRRDLSPSSDSDQTDDDHTRSSKTKKHAGRDEVEEEDSSQDSDAEDNAEDEKTYEVETIKGHRNKGGTIKYKIGWKGYPDEDTWEPEDNLKGSEEILKKYKLENGLLRPSKSRPSNVSIASSTKKPSSKGSHEKPHSLAASDASRKRKRSPQPSKSTIAPLRKNGTNGPTKADRDSVKDRKPSRTASPLASDDESFDDEKWHAQYENRPSWENLIKNVRTVEKVQADDEVASTSSRDALSNGLNICLLWKAGRTSWVSNKTARAKLPQKLLDFYEDHLQFTTAEQ
ncbi:hypothetical protein O181_000801 [Austropuccinia psidii MF-1]|uniref:Chromo domain-containing protein n=1 Tax=Austropuccinia psidii MF-1 TaxID=1389203 RepID=A0A9Q3B966_9BASI|nr:hypothetical protein [Austropuccinia psidii MF-1]